MVKDAEANADADKKQKENIEIKNKADSMSYEIEKQLKEHEDKVPAEEKEAVETIIAKIKTASDANDYEALETLTAELEGKMQGLYQHFQPGPEAGAAAAAAGAAPQGEAPQEEKKKKDDDVIDADFDMVD